MNWLSIGARNFSRQDASGLNDKLTDLSENWFFGESAFPDGIANSSQASNAVIEQYFEPTAIANANGVGDAAVAQYFEPGSISSASLAGSIEFELSGAPTQRPGTIPYGWIGYIRRAFRREKAAEKPKAVDKAVDRPQLISPVFALISTARGQASAGGEFVVKIESAANPLGAKVESRGSRYAIRISPQATMAGDRATAKVGEFKVAAARNPSEIELIAIIADL